MNRLVTVGSVIAVALLVTACASQEARPVFNTLVRQGAKEALESAPKAPRALPVVERAVPRAPLVTIAPESVALPAAAESASERLTGQVDALAVRVAATPAAESDIRRCTGGAMENVAQAYAEGVGQGVVPNLGATFHEAMTGCLSGVYPAEMQTVELVTQSVHAIVSGSSHDASAAGLTALQYYAWLRTAYQPSA